MGTPREHIEEIRRNKYQIGLGTISVSRDLRMAVKYLSTELYSQDAHFLMELIQNAEDNEYEEGVQPSLEFLLTSKDITRTGAPMTLLVFNNEKGFSRQNMDSICSIGGSSKSGLRRKGYIGEKGIGFKSVFLLTSQPYIFSNGYQVRFNEQPCEHCEIAYIVPEWVDENPTITDIEGIYGSSQLPTTTIVLPLKHDKVEPVKNQLSSIHPELLLFLLKIRKLSVKEADDGHQNMNSLSAISISSEKDFVAKKNIDAESFTLHLTSEEEDGKVRECRYYMWRQRFPVRQENRVERRIEVDEWLITLAFPLGKRLVRGMIEAGIYAFLPTEMVTNFPFIIQADFILQSSREKIMLDDIWNKGILCCVPTAFMDAFTCLVKSDEDAPVSSIASFFDLLPIKGSTFHELNVVRESIKQRVVKENIVPAESFSSQLFFCKPPEVGRILHAFWNILYKAKEQGVTFHNLSSHGKFILSNSFDTDKSEALKFLGVKYVDLEWYTRCIQSYDLVLVVENDVYVKLLEFFARRWNSRFETTSVKKIPLLKYVDKDGDTSLLSIEEVAAESGPILCRSKDLKHASWLIRWSKEFKCAAELYFMPEDVQVLCSKSGSLLTWLRDYAKVKTLSVFSYAKKLLESSRNRRLALAFARFLHHSSASGYLLTSYLPMLFQKMPIISSYGEVIVQKKGVLVPANGSKWVQLVHSNPWKAKGYVELHKDYLRKGNFGSQQSSEKELLDFLRKYIDASDIPDIIPPNEALACVSAPLTKENAFLLLHWIQKIRSKGTEMPSKFLKSIKEGSWLRVSMSGCTGYRPPCQSFLHSSSWGSLLQNASVMIDIPMIDQDFYDNKLTDYQEELKAVGVMSTYGEVCTFIADHLMSLADSSCLTRNNAIAMLGLIRFLRDKYLSPDTFIASIMKGNWMMTSQGVRSPVGSVLFKKSWKVASEVSNIPFIDLEYYGNSLLEHETELQPLGVVVDEFNGNYSIVEEYLKPSSCLNYMTSDALILLLKCVRICTAPEKIVATLKSAKCIKTNNGFRYPSESFLDSLLWGNMLQVFDAFPCVDGGYYANKLLHYKCELAQIGVMIEFEGAKKAFLKVFKEKVSQAPLTKKQVLSVLACYRVLRRSRLLDIPGDIRNCITEESWLRTRLAAYKPPRDCILFDSSWEPISEITTPPFIEDSDRYYGEEIHKYKDELSSIGVVIDIEKGASMVLSHLHFPDNPNEINPASVLSLLNCIRHFLLDTNGSLPDSFLNKVYKKAWLKTKFGYRAPDECILFGSKWGDFFSISDVPFIDEEHYGTAIASYGKELLATGVNNDIKAGSSILARHLMLLSDFDTIKRIYTYLEQHDWEPEDEASSMIWIPNGAGRGEDGAWACPSGCVLYNKDKLFSSRLIVLEKHYDYKLLCFFGRAFHVRFYPSMDDYCQLWKDWESSGNQLSHADCCSFWSHVVSHWNVNAEKILSEGLSRFPASSSSSVGIQLVDKRDIFIPDDLLLKDLFLNCSDLPLFVWTPQPNHPDIPQSKLLAIYKSIGVQTISSSVMKAESLTPAVCLNGKETKLADVFIRKGLLMLVLGFLANPVLAMDTMTRHQTVERLLNLAALQTDEPVTMRYSLTLSSGIVLDVDSSEMIYWDQNVNKMYAQKLDRSQNQKIVFEYATNFARVLSEGLSWEKEHHIPELAELIKVGFLVDFDVDAVVYYMKSKNMQMFPEDEEFLSSAYPSKENVGKKRRKIEQKEMALQGRNYGEMDSDPAMCVPKTEDA